MSDIAINVLKKDQKELRKLIDNWKYSSLEYLRSSETVDLPGYCMKEIEGISKKKDSYLIIAQTSDQILGFAVYSNLPWDSDHFKKRMGTVNYLIVDSEKEDRDQIANKLLRYVIDRCKKEGIEFLLCKTSTNDYTAIHSLERNGFLVMDTTLNFYCDFQCLPDINKHLKCTDFKVRLADAADCNELVDISRRAFTGHIGRYHNDENIPNKMATGVYELWLKSSCSGWADWILVAEKEGRIAGYSAWKKPSDNQRKYGIDLVSHSISAIDPDFQRQGLFRLLTLESMKLIRGNYRYSEGRTVTDIFAVQRGYIRLGWKICGGQHSFHKWL
jgi:ribosomal protein S18 acetylase RimI-like enzyme